jgi:uncharacterized protein YbjT (DUF2867 family)
MFVVAGASGRTGAEVGRGLLARETTVRVVVRNPDKGASWLERGAEVAVASLQDTAALQRTLMGAEGFLAVLPDELSVEHFHEHRRRMADAIAAAVKASRVPHVVLISSIAAFLEDGNGPPRDLHYAEQVLRETGATLTVVRASQYQDNTLSPLPAATHEGVYPSFLPADLVLPMVATRDVGRLAAKLLAHPPAKAEIIDLLGPSYSARQLAAALGRALGKPLHVVELPPPAHVDTLMKFGASRSAAEALAEMFACVASGRITPHGDRTERGTTEIDDVIASALAS